MERRGFGLHIYWEGRGRRGALKVIEKRNFFHGLCAKTQEIRDIAIGMMARSRKTLAVWRFWGVRRWSLLIAKSLLLLP